MSAVLLCYEARLLVDPHKSHHIKSYTAGHASTHASMAVRSKLDMLAPELCHSKTEGAEV